MNLKENTRDTKKFGRRNPNMFKGGYLSFLLTYSTYLDK